MQTGVDAAHGGMGRTEMNSSPALLCRLPLSSLGHLHKAEDAFVHTSPAPL